MAACSFNLRIERSFFGAIRVFRMTKATSTLVGLRTRK